MALFKSASRKAGEWHVMLVDQARQAKADGDVFFEVELEPGYVDVLADIEAAGWRLEHVGYVHATVRHSSRDKLLSTGQVTSVEGGMIGIYLFRNTETPSLTPSLRS